MSLTGTLDSFALPDVLRFLGAGRKTGRLALQGERSGGDVWLIDGDVVAVRVATTDDLLDAACELLRAEEGAFEFLAEALGPDDGQPIPIEELLSGAHERLAAWQAIEAVVPSAGVPVALAPAITGDVMLAPSDWVALVAVAAARCVHDVGAVLGLGAFAAASTVKELVERGLVVVGEDAAGVPAQGVTPEAGAVDSVGRAGGVTGAAVEEVGDDATEAATEAATETATESAAGAATDDAAEAVAEAAVAEASDASAEDETSEPAEVAEPAVAAPARGNRPGGSTESTVATEQGRAVEAIRRLTARQVAPEPASEAPGAGDATETEVEEPATASAAETAAATAEATPTTAATTAAAVPPSEKIDGPAYAAGIRDLGAESDRGKLLKFLSSVRT